MSDGTVFIGVPDAKMEAESSSWSYNKLGGLPDWMRNKIGHPKCKNCQKSMCLIVQVYSPLYGSPRDRTNYVFCCLEKLCWSTRNGWCAFRMESSTESVPVKQPPPPQPAPTATTGWGDDADDWGDDDGWGDSTSTAQQPTHVENNRTSTDLSTAMEDMSISNVSSTNNTGRESLDNFSSDAPYHTIEPYYINVHDQSELYQQNDAEDEHVKQLLDRYQQSEELQGSAAVGGAAQLCFSEENYEEESEDEELYQEFYDEIQKCQEQVIRYEVGGSPLLMKQENLSSIPRCPKCGAPRRYEFQLMPGLVPYLHLGQNEMIEFGTVLVYTCSASCWQEDSVISEEFIVYTSDPDLKYFKGSR